MSPLTVEQVIAELERAGWPVDHQAGENGVSSTCPCCPGVMSWVDIDGWRRWICDSGCDSSRIADALHHAESSRTWNGNGAVAERYDGRVLDVGAILAQPDEPIPWRCENLAADGYLTVLAGRGGEGKSWMALALACGVARGQAPAGIPCAKGRALIFDAENGPRLIARRFRAAGVTAALEVQPVDSGGLRFGADLDWFREVIGREQANLVVFDSLRVLSTGAKESDGDEMEPIVTALKQLARDTGAAVLLIHHRGKGETSDYRGSSVILDQTDMLFTLGRIQGDPEGRQRRKVTTIKCRIEEEPAPRWVAIEADRARGLVFVNEAEPYEPDDGGRPRDQLRDQVLELLAGIPRSGRNIAEKLGESEPTVRRVLHDLDADGLAEKRGAGRGAGWVRPEMRHASPPIGDGALTQSTNGAGNGAVEPNASASENASVTHLFEPNGDQTCDGCGARLTHFGGRLACFACTSAGGA